MLKLFKRIDIKSISVKGFKGYKEKKTFNLNAITKIIAENGKGKTSLGEAVTWAFLGSNLLGNERVDSLLLNNSSKEIEVTVLFTDEENKENNLTRTRRSNTTNILLNNKEIKQSELTLMLGTKNVFLSIFNPEYCNIMPEKDFRDFVVSVLPSIDIDTIAMKMSDYELDLIKDKLSLIHNNPNNYLEGKRKDIKEMEDNLIYIDGKISGLNLEKITEEDKQFDDSELLKLEKEMRDISSNKPVIDKTEVDALAAKKVELEKKLIEAESKELTKPDTTELFQNIKELEKNIALLEKEKFIVSENVLKEKYSLESEIKHLRDIYSKERKIDITLGDNCPMCKTLITEIQLSVVKSEKDLRLKEIIKNAQAKQLKIDTIEKEIKENRNNFETLRNKKIEDFKVKHEKHTNELNSINTNFTKSLTSFAKQKNTFIQNTNNKIKEIEHSIEKLKLKYQKEEEMFQEKVNSKLNDLQNRITELRKEKAKIDAYNVELRLKKEKYESDIEEHQKLLKEIDNVQANISQYKNQISACNQYTAYKVEHLSDIMHKHLNNVTIELQKIVKSTGELKDCFEIRYKNKPFKVLSTSEKIKAGLEIANLVINLTDFHFPIFIDNAESITEYEVGTNVQIIEAKVVEGQELFVGSVEDLSKLEAKGALSKSLYTNYFSKFIDNPESITEHDISSIINIIKSRDVKKKGQSTVSEESLSVAI